MTTATTETETARRTREMRERQERPRPHLRMYRGLDPARRHDLGHVRLYPDRHAALSDAVAARDGLQRRLRVS